MQQQIEGKELPTSFAGSNFDSSERSYQMDSFSKKELWFLAHFSLETLPVRWLTYQCSYQMKYSYLTYWVKSLPISKTKINWLKSNICWRLDCRIGVFFSAANPLTKRWTTQRIMLRLPKALNYSTNQRLQVRLCGSIDPCLLIPIDTYTYWSMYWSMPLPINMWSRNLSKNQLVIKIYFADCGQDCGEASLQR